MLIGTLSVFGVSCNQTPGVGTFDATTDTPTARDQRVADNGADQRDTSTPARTEYLIVAADSLKASAERYRAFRQRSGYRVELVMLEQLRPPGSGAPSAVEIKERVRQVYQARDTARPFYLLLLGDADSPLPAGTYHEPYDDSEVTSDNYYADMDGDHVPDLAVGRIPARDDAELDRAQAKVAAYESGIQPGPWKQRLSIFASLLGSGTVDAMFEQLALYIADTLSYDYDITFTYGSETSPYVYVPERFSDEVYERFNEGALGVLHIGHGSRSGLDTLTWNGAEYPVWDLDQLEALLDVQDRLPVFVTTSCLLGAFDNYDSIAEKVLRATKGPPAVIASTETTDSYAGIILTRELAVLVTERLEPTIGLLLVEAKERLVHHNDAVRALIDGFAATLYSPEERDARKRTHLHMFTLFGDPGMALRYVGEQGTISVDGNTPKAGALLPLSARFKSLSSGTARFTLECRRNTILGSIDPVPPDGDPQRDQVIADNYHTANDKVAASAEVSFDSSEAHATLKIPTDLPAGAYYVKVFASNGVQDAFGHQPVTVAE